jgi:hypothetical protein
MESSNDDIRLKSRSTVATVKAGYQLYFSHFRTLMRISWLQALIYAAFCGMLGLFAVVLYPRLIYRMAFLESTATVSTAMVTQMLCYIAFIVFTVLLGAIAEVVFYSRGLTMLRQHNDTGVILTPARWITFDRRSAWRMIKMMLCLAVLIIPFCILMGILQHWIITPDMRQPLAHAGSLIIVAVGIFVIALFYLPLTHICMEYLLQVKGGFWGILRHTYGVALRHFGYIFATMLVTGIIIGVSTLIILLPAEILTAAFLQSNMGQLMGDALNMPTYATLLAVVVFFISGFVQGYIRISALFVYYYMNGSIHTQEQERKQVKL